MLNILFVFRSSVFYAASRNGELPKFMAMIHNSRFTPIPGLIVQVSLKYLKLYASIYTVILRTITKLSS
jgi:amino acid transporter